MRDVAAKIEARNATAGMVVGSPGRGPDLSITEEFRRSIAADVQRLGPERFGGDLDWLQPPTAH